MARPLFTRKSSSGVARKDAMKPAGRGVRIPNRVVCGCWLSLSNFGGFFSEEAASFICHCPNEMLVERLMHDLLES